jgi:hypothetical protein
MIKGAILKCVDGTWSAKDGSEINTAMKFLCIGTRQALQRWQDASPIEVIAKEAGKSLPDVNELNARIPQDEWETGLDGRPRPPWTRAWFADFIRESDAAAYTFVNSTFGARIAVERLDDKVFRMRMLMGADVVPIITLGSAPMKTQFGTKLRPEFNVTAWRELNRIEPPKPVQQIGKQESTTEEVFDDAIPFDGSKSSKRAA